MNQATENLCCRAQGSSLVVPSDPAFSSKSSVEQLPQGCYNCRIKKVLDFIESSPIESVSLEAAAAVLRISPSRFRHLFKDYVGVSFHKYVIRLRLERAHHLLRTTSFTVEKIAGMLGIQDLSHFARDFKRAYGVSPGATRCTVANMVIARSSHNGHLQQENLCLNVDSL